MKIPVVFLGTGQAIPTARRNHTAVLVKYKDETILIDCGEGTQRQFRKAKINPCKLTRLLITHWHGDHVLGIPGLLQTLCLNNYNKTLDIYGPKNTKKFLGLMLKLFVKVGKIKINIHECSSGEIFETKDFKIEAREMKHGTPCLAYSMTEKDKIRISKDKIKQLGLKGKIISKLQEGKDIIFKGKKIKAEKVTYEEKGKKLTFIFDTAINSNAVKIAENSDLLVCESTYTDKEKNLAEEYKHLTSSQAAQIAKLSNSKKLVLTHLSQRYEQFSKQKTLLNEAKKIFKNTAIAEDLEMFEI